MLDLALSLPLIETTISLRWPFALLAVLLPFIVRLLLKPAPSPKASLRMPHLHELKLKNEHLLNWARYRMGLASVAYIALCVAAARPVFFGDHTHIPRTGRDLMLVVDISQSMDQQDWGISTTRMDVVKHVVRDFIERRLGDRIGVIVFGSRAYLQTPLTFDLNAVKQQWNGTFVGLAGPATALGDAIGLTIKHLRHVDANHKVMVLISDGAANAGRVTTEEAARVATQFGLRVYPIGIGSVAHNDTASASYDAQFLQTLASTTGGQFFQARMRSELEAVYRALDELEPATLESDVVRQESELYPWPLALALLLIAILFVGESRSSNVGHGKESAT